jgi:FkbM family methyltransferase
MLNLLLDRWRRLNSRRYENLVSGAMSVPGGVAHEAIRRRAAEWIGLRRSRRPARLRRGFVHRILKAVRRQGSGMPAASLGAHPIGVGDIRIECFNTDSNTASVYLFGFSDNLPIYDVYRDRILPGSVAVDVGANVGMHTLVMAHYAAHGRVYSYEPSPAIFARLSHNLAINQARNVEPRMLAVSSRPGHVGYVDASSKPNIGTSRVDADADTTVPAVTLDDELAAAPAVNLIKIDVEGHELEVLRGARTVLATQRPAVVLEFNGTSYSLPDLCSCFPYPIRILRIPDTYYQAVREVHPQSNGPIPGVFNALVVPLNNQELDWNAGSRASV